MKKTNRTSGIQLLTTIVLVMGLLISAVGIASAAYPDRDIQLIVPWPAGGGTDSIARMVAQYAEKRLGVPVVVVNKAGAGGAIGTRAVATAKPDGYTVGIVGSGVLARQYILPNPTLIDELKPIAFVGGEASAITVRADTQWKTLSEFVSYVKAHPNEVRVATDAPGGASFIAATILENAFDMKFIKVPYQGFAPSVAALQAGEVVATTVPVPDVIQLHETGSARILGVMETHRHFMAQDVPTVEEATGTQVVHGLWRSFYGPAGLPADKGSVLEKAFVDAMNDPELQKKAHDAGFTISPLASEATGKRWEADDEALYPILLDLDMVVTPRK